MVWLLFGIAKTSSNCLQQSTTKFTRLLLSRKCLYKEIIHFNWWIQELIVNKGWASITFNFVKFWAVIGRSSTQQMEKHVNASRVTSLMESTWLVDFVIKFLLYVKIVSMMFNPVPLIMMIFNVQIVQTDITLGESTVMFVGTVFCTVQIVVWMGTPVMSVLTTTSQILTVHQWKWVVLNALWRTVSPANRWLVVLSAIKTVVTSSIPPQVYVSSVLYNIAFIVCPSPSVKSVMKQLTTSLIVLLYCANRAASNSVWIVRLSMNV